VRSARCPGGADSTAERGRSFVRRLLAAAALAVVVLLGGGAALANDSDSPDTSAERSAAQEAGERHLALCPMKCGGWSWY
jgi:hypothetical protein